MKLEIHDGAPVICSFNIDDIKTDIKWFDVDRNYFFVLEEKEDGFLDIIGVYEKLPLETGTELIVKAQIEVIYKDYALVKFGLGRYDGKDEIDVDIVDEKFVVRKEEEGC